MRNRGCVVEFGSAKNAQISILPEEGRIVALVTPEEIICTLKA
jgi:hypothetical protein